MENKYLMKVQFVFEGEVEIVAKDKEQAKEYFKNHVGLVIGGNIHTTMPDDEVNWNFPIHPDKIVKSIKKVR